MRFKKFQWHILIRVTLLFVTLACAAFLLVKELFLFELIILPVIFYQVLDFYRLHNMAQNEVAEFVESLRRRDFSRNFNVSAAPLDLKPLRKEFNEINSAFKVISREKETQYQYLQKILELVDTGILSYETESGELVWMNL